MLNVSCGQAVKMKGSLDPVTIVIDYLVMKMNNYNSQML